MREAAAYRAAGQAVAAILEGAPIANICLDGIEIAWPDGPTPRSEILADIAIGVAGIASEEAFRFGNVHWDTSVAHHRFTDGQIEDFAEVHELVDQIDPAGADDVMLSAWRQAVELIAGDAMWAAIERVAGEIYAGAEFRGDDVARIVNAVQDDFIGHPSTL